jgi:hypothetical protein
VIVDSKCLCLLWKFVDSQVLVCIILQTELESWYVSFSRGGCKSAGD